MTDEVQTDDQRDDGIWSRDRWSTSVMTEPLLRGRVVSWRRSDGPSDEERGQIRDDAEHPYRSAYAKGMLTNLAMWAVVIPLQFTILVDDPVPTSWLVLPAAGFLVLLAFVARGIRRRTQRMADLLDEWNHRVDAGLEDPTAPSD